MNKLKLKIVVLIIMLGFLGMNYVEAQVSSPSASNQNQTITKPTRKIYPHVVIEPYGGAIFPLPKILNQNFKPGGLLGLDVGYRVNKELAFYGTFGYYFMHSKINGAPIGSYYEFSGGPRYYFVHPKLNSQLFLEAGVGAYNFRQNSYVDPSGVNGAVINQINNTKPGINAGAGATLGLSNVVDVMVKSKYNVIFTPNGTTSFLTVAGGLAFRFR